MKNKAFEGIKWSIICSLPIWGFIIGMIWLLQSDFLWDIVSEILYK